MSEKVELAERIAERVSTLARTKMYLSLVTWNEISNDILAGVAALRASSPAQETVTMEPVAWTNESQLGFLKEPGYRVVPMAMWAFQHSAHPIALYAIPAPPQPGREDSELEELVAQAIWEECCPGMKWGQIDHLIYCRMAGAAIAKMRVLTGEPK